MNNNTSSAGNSATAVTFTKASLLEARALATQARAVAVRIRDPDLEWSAIGVLCYVDVFGSIYCPEAKMRSALMDLRTALLVARHALGLEPAGMAESPSQRARRDAAMERAAYW